MPYITLNGAKLYYEVSGTGKPLVLVSGYCGTTLSWALVFEQLAQYFQVITLDNRGSGVSEVTKDPYSIAQLADDVISLVDALELDKPHIIGNSMGGAIVQSIAARHGDKVDKVIISNSSSCFNHQIRFASGYFMERYKAKEDLLEQAKLWLPLLFSSDFIANQKNVEAYLKQSVEYPKPMTYQGMANQYQALIDFDSTAWLNTIHNPTLILSGDEDNTCLPKEALYLHQQIANSKLHIFENCAHLPHIEKVDEYLEVILGFLLP